MKYDVVALGELLIDFTESGETQQGNSLFEACPGGAPCNVLAMLSKLEKRVAFIGKVGDDMFGRLLKQIVSERNIDVSGLILDKETPTTLAFVKTLAGGDRDFSFYRSPGADMMLSDSELRYELIENTKIFHFGTISMTHEGERKATKNAVKSAKNSGTLISFDPNLRPPLWTDLQSAKEQIEWGLGVCDILKIADNELEFITGETGFYKGAEILQKKYPNIKILNVTAGKDGSYSFYPDGKPVFVPSFTLGGTIETTGAGDTFCACVLAFVLENGINGLNEGQRESMLRFANAAAYVVTTRKGAIKSMPDLSEIERILK